jgi:uncharacterized protein YqjF (DUF2071 family)
MMRQTWHDLLFAHWPIPKSRLRAFVPEPLEIEEHDGMSWVTLVPVRLTGVSLRLLPSVPLLSSFTQLNLRLYVTHEGKPGLWFVTLDASSPLTVWAARRFLHLPYHEASMRFARRHGAVRFVSSRVQGAAELFALYRPAGAATEEKSSLETFLVERYCNYSRTPEGDILRTEVHHHPWSLQKAEVEIETNSVLTSAGLDVIGAPSLVQFARRQDVVVYPPVRTADHTHRGASIDS